MQPKYGSTSLCDQNCGVQPADRHTPHATRTDESLKTEGPMILSINDIFYFKTVIIGGPIKNNAAEGDVTINDMMLKYKSSCFP